MNKNPYKVYCDFESLLVKQTYEKQKKTVTLNDHIPVSYCLYFMSYDTADNKLITYKGLDCVDHLFKELKKIE